LFRQINIVRIRKDSGRAGITDYLSCSCAASWFIAGL
jgi:hypothetical protein